MAIISKEKQSVKANWPIQKIQQEMTRIIASKIITRLRFMENGNEAFIEKFEKISAEQVANAFKKSGVKTPLDLVEHMAERAANLFGAQVQYAGDARSATLFNEKPTVWLEAKKNANMNVKQEQLMHKHYENWQRDLASAFGFSAKVEITNNGDSSIVTFTKTA